MNITFDMTALDNAGLTGSNVFITFAASTSNMAYDPTGTNEAINFSAGSITINKVAYGTSKAYSLKDIATNSLVLNSATSLVGFISYGSAKGIELLGVGSQPNFLDPSTTRYSIFEISYDGTSGGADITNISQYGGSIKIGFLNGSTAQSSVSNTLATTDMFRKLAATSGSSSSVVCLDGDGHFVRIIGTNIFPNGAIQTPYPTFNAYLQSLFATYGSLSIVKELTNLAPGQSHGGTGSVGFVSAATAVNVTPNTTYNLDYHFTAVITQVTTGTAATNDPNGTYSVELAGHVNATLAVANTNNIESYNYSGLSITIAADDLVGQNLYMTNFIYQAATAGAGIDVTSAGWSTLNADFGSANINAAALQKAAGDFAEGMTCGFPGSTTPSTSVPGKNLGELTSYEWWLNPQLAYEPAQPANAYYSAYGNVVNANSAGVNSGVTFSRGGVYGSPYDDRFNLNLISPDANTTEMCITLLADGDLKPAS